jgi:hypothetical protein
MGRSSLCSRIAFAELMLTAVLFAATCPPASAQQPQPETAGNQPYPAYQDDLPATLLSHIKAPLPPREVGCFRLDQNRQWEAIPCASDEYLREHPVPPPITNAIQSTPNAMSFSNRTTIFATPFVLGSIAFRFTSNPVRATETDVRPTTNPDGTPGPTVGTANAFSVQNNTNSFPCATCSSGYPFPAVAGIPNSASRAGDQGWIQFVYQQFSLANWRLCIWTVDVNIANNTRNAGISPGVDGGYANSSTAGYHMKCAAVSSPARGPLTGPGALVGEGQIVGYVNCPTVVSKAGCLLQIIADLPWLDGVFSFSDNDTMGLSGNWNNVSGDILGSGSGSAARLKNIQVFQILYGFSCVVAPFDVSIGWQACPPPDPRLAWMFELSARPSFNSTTAETNNLVDEPATFSCHPWDCGLWWDASVPLIEFRPTWTP